MSTLQLQEERRKVAGPQPLGSKSGWIAKVQRAWAERPIEERVRVLRAWRHGISQKTDALCIAIAAGPARTVADVRVSEILPLLEACEFLEKNVAKILATRSLGGRGRPLWLKGVESEVKRVALGRVLVIGPSNYPLFLPGVQVLQALVAGNAVTWKPGRGGRAVAKLFAAEMADAGLPRELLRLMEESDEAGQAAIAAGADKVFFTGSASVGKAIMRQLAETATPCVMELSDNAAVVVLPRAELGRVTAAVVFGMRLNASATCMAPRRLLVMSRTPARRQALVQRLQRELAKVPPMLLEGRLVEHLRKMLAEAREQGATVLGQLCEAGAGQMPIIVVDVRPEMRIAQMDAFAPVLSVIDVTDSGEVAAAQRACPYGLTVSIFGDEQVARRLANRMTVGTVVINDVIVPTADPRIPFGGRGASGFGVTRGAEGLLEMTAIKTVLVRHGTSRRQHEVTGEQHSELFEGLIQAGHSKSWLQRTSGLRHIVGAAQALKQKEKAARQSAPDDEKRERYDGD